MSPSVDVQAENANYLRLSYALGPNESWIALWRNRLAFSLFERLPTDLSDDALDEFIKLVDTESAIFRGRGDFFYRYAGCSKPHYRASQNGKAHSS